MSGKQTPAWVPWEAAKWSASTAILDRETEFDFFRLVNECYVTGSAHLVGSIAKLALVCKAEVKSFRARLDLLAELGKVRIVSDGVIIPSVEWRLEDVAQRLKTKQDAIAAARAARRAKTEGALTTSEKTIDDSSPLQDTTEQNKEKKRGKPPPSNFWIEKTDEAVKAWNDLATELGLPVAETITPARRKAIAACLSTMDGLDGWRLALDQIRASPFLQGKAAGARPDWRADLDFITKPDKFVKLIEGGYRDERSGGRPAPHAKPPPVIDEPPDKPDPQWLKVKAELREKLGDEKYQSWFGRARLVGEKADVVTISLPSKFIAKWAADHYGELLTELWRKARPTVTGAKIVSRGPTIREGVVAA